MAMPSTKGNSTLRRKKSTTRKTTSPISQNLICFSVVIRRGLQIRKSDTRPLLADPAARGSLGDVIAERVRRAERRFGGTLQHIGGAVFVRPRLAIGKAREPRPGSHLLFIREGLRDLGKAQLPSAIGIQGQAKVVARHRQAQLLLGSGEGNVEAAATLGYAEDFVTTYLQTLEEEEKLIKIGEKKEISCNQCDSVRTSQIFYCPNCKSSDFKLGKLIEHYDCGNVSVESTYQNDECPDCKKKIKALGVDYKVLQNQYICNNCQEFFPEISIDYLCLKCENRFKLEDARWQSSTNYKIK